MEYKRYEKYNDSGIEWIGEIPEQWQVKKIKYCSKIYGRIGFRGYTVEDLVLEGEGAVTLSPSNIDNQKLIFNKKTYISWEKYYESPEIMIYNGDILLVKTASVGKVAFVQGLSEKATINPQFVVFKDVSINNKFLYYVMISENLQRQIKMATYGGVVGTLTQQEISNYLLVGPISIQEQITISTFLDKKTSEIDDLIADKEKLIELLQEQRQAIITEAVTKGLNPNVKMKDSGIEWIGEIPEHWETKKLKYTCSLIKDGTHNPPQRVNDGVPILSVRNIVEGKFINLPDDSLISEEDYRELNRSYQVRKNDVLIAIVGATIGKVAIVGDMEPFTIQRSLAFFRFKKSVINYKFAHFCFQSSRFQSLLWGHVGFSAQPGIYLGALANFFIPAPSLQEQENIVAYLEKEENRVNELINKIEQEIDCFKAYRQSIISEVVTGKIDVRGYSA